MAKRRVVQTHIWDHTMGSMDAVSMFQTQVKKGSFQWKSFISKPGAWLALGEAAGETN